MVMLSDANASVIQGLIAQKGLNTNAKQMLRLCNAKDKQCYS